MWKHKPALWVLSVAAAAAVGHAWMPEPWDIATVSLAYILAGVSLVLFAVARTARSN